MELRVQEVNGALRAVVRDADGVDHPIGNVVSVRVDSHGPGHWQVEVNAAFAEKPLK